jgi:hypothetical protein
MMVECSFEQDLLDAIHTGRWPARADAALSSHVASCAVCRDVAAVAVAVVDAAAEPLSGAVQVPDAGAVWLRAQWRARADAARRATHPITAVQAAGLACLAAIGGALFGASSGWFQKTVGSSFAGVQGWIPDHVAVNEAVVSLVATHVTIAIGIAAVVVIAPAFAFWIVKEKAG